MLKLPRQNPTLTALPTQVCVSTSMHEPGWPFMHAASWPRGRVVVRGVGFVVRVDLASACPLGQQRMWVAPEQNPARTLSPRHVCVFVLMHVPGWFARQASPPGAFVVIFVVTCDALAAFWELGQHWILVPPSQYPAFRTAPTQEWVSLLMQIPDWPNLHASFAGGLGGGVVGVVSTDVFSRFVPDGQHLLNASPGQSPVRTLVPTQTCVLMFMQMPACPRKHASARGVIVVALMLEVPEEGQQRTWVSPGHRLLCVPTEQVWLLVLMHEPEHLDDPANVVVFGLCWPLLQQRTLPAPGHWPVTVLPPVQTRVLTSMHAPPA